MKSKKNKDISTQQNHDKNNLNKLDTPMKIYDYQNRVHMRQKRINEKIKEEQKNIEKSLSHFNINFQSLTSRNFFSDYKKFSNKYFGTTNLIEDIAGKYQEKGYNVPDFNFNFFKVNPLLDSNVNKLYISFLFNKKEAKVDYEKLYRTNKGVKYIKRLLNFISPEIKEEEKEKHIKSKKKKNKKLKLLKKEDRKSKLSMTRTIPILNITNEKNNKYGKYKNNSNRNLHIYQYTDKINDRYINKFNEQLFNNNFKNKINRSKSINSNIPLIIKTEREKNRSDTHKFKLNNRKGLYLNISNEPSKTKYSSNNLMEINTHSNINNIIGSSKKKPRLFINTEKITDNNSEDYMYETPEIQNKNQIYINNENKSSNTKPFSSTTNEEHNNFFQSSKTKNSLTSFKIKEFSIISKNNKNASSKKIHKIFNPKHLKYSYTIIKNENETNEIGKVINDAEILYENKDKIYLKEKEEKINQIYKELKAGKYENIENKMKNYLSYMKKLNKNEIDFMMKKYEYKNIKSNFNELKKFINEKKLSKKIERIYLNNHDYNRIEPLVTLLNDKNREICGFEGKITNIYNK